MMPATTAPGISDLLEVAAQQSPAKLALVEASGRSLTWAELDEEVSRVATGLGDAGIVAGYRVVIAQANRLEFVTTYLGVLRAQAVAVPLNPASAVEELTRVIADCGARMIVADHTTVVPVRAAVAGLETPPRVVGVGVTLLPGERSYDHLRAARPQRAPELTDPERLAVLLYTSGTSGPPRAAMLSHRALRANIEQVATTDPPMVHGDDVVLGVLPLFHVYGLNGVLGAVLRQRAKLVMLERFDPQAVLDVIEDEACSVVPLAPPIFDYWRAEENLAERLGPVRLVISGSAPLAVEVAADFEQRTGLRVHQGYGLTEAAPVVTSTLGLSDRPRSGSEGAAVASTDARLSTPGSVGVPLPGIEVRLLDTDGAPAESGDPGEIALRGANLFSGYWPDGGGGPDAQGWWCTGDLGLLGAGGDLALVDRVREVVVVSGFTVYPMEVEDVVREVAGVLDVAVVAAPDERTGHSVIAYVVGDPDGDPDGDLAARIDDHCRGRLARFKQPARVEVVASLPLTVTGKVAKGRLRVAERARAAGLLE